MNFLSWNFSEEVQPELQEFLTAVREHGNKNNEAQILLQNILYEDNELIQIKHSQKMNYNLTPDTDNKNIDNLASLTIIDQTIVESQTNILSPDIDDFINNMQDYLENKDASIQIDHLRKLSNYDEFNLDYFFKNIYTTLSVNGFANLVHWICIYNETVINHVAVAFCKNVLLEKLQNHEQTYVLKKSTEEFIKTFPDITRTELMIPLMQTEHVTLWPGIIIDMQSESENQLLLRDFLFTSNILEVWQFSIVQSLLGPQTEYSVKCRLISLMEISADKFSKDKQFMVLVIAVIKHLDRKGFDDQGQILHNIIEKSHTLLKLSAQRELREWNEKCEHY